MRILGLVLLCLLAALLLLLLALLFLPAWAILELKYDKLTVRVRVLFLTFTVFPMKEKEPEEPKPQQEAPTGQKKRSPGKKFELTFSKVMRWVADAAGILRMALAALRFRGIRLTLPVQGEDAADTALFYGKFSAWFYAGVATLQNFLDLRFDHIELIPDFAGENKYRRSFYCKIGATPFIMLVVAFKAFGLLRRDGLLPGSGPGEKKAPPSQEGTAAAPRAGGADIGGSENE